MQISSLLGHTQELLKIVLNSIKPADSLIETFFRSHKYLGSHDRRFIAETTYGTMRHQRRCEYVLKSALTSIGETLLEEDTAILLIIAYLSLQGKMRDVAPEIISDRLKNASLAKKCPFLIDNLSKPVTVTAGSVIQQIGIEYSFPDWMVKKFAEQYGESEAEKICSSLNEQAPLTIRVNTLKTSVDQCREELNMQGIETTRTSLSPLGLTLKKRINIFSLPMFRNGWFEVQDEGSQLLPLLLDPKPNAKILDVCAGAGGKTLEFAALMKNRGEIYATDINSFRLEELRKRTKRAGAQNVRVQEIQTIEDLVQQFSGFFDIVFVDAPCSGLGTIRRNPGMKRMVTEQTVLEVSEKQRTILGSSARLVKPGGKLLYATCTLLREENEDVVEEFVSKHLEFKSIEVKGLMDRWNAADAVMGTSIKFLPYAYGTDGFFCSILEKQPVR